MVMGWRRHTPYAIRRRARGEADTTPLAAAARERAHAPLPPPREKPAHGFGARAPRLARLMHDSFRVVVAHERGRWPGRPVGPDAVLALDPLRPAHQRNPYREHASARAAAAHRPRVPRPPPHPSVDPQNKRTSESAPPSRGEGAG